MPFSGQYDDTFLVAIQPAALALNAVADRVDHAARSGDVVQQIKALIKVAQVVVADLSESRANVCHGGRICGGARQASSADLCHACCRPSIQPEEQSDNRLPDRADIQTQDEAGERAGQSAIARSVQLHDSADRVLALLAPAADRDRYAATEPRVWHKQLFTGIFVG